MSVLAWIGVGVVVLVVVYIVAVKIVTHAWGE